MFQFLRICGNTAAFAIYFVTFVALVALIVFLVTPFGWLLIPAAIAVWIGMAKLARQRRGSSVVEYVDHAARMNMPLAESVAAAAASESGRLKQTLTKLAGELFDGIPTGEAMRRTVHELPASQLSVIQAGEHTGRLAPALRRVARIRRNAVDAESPMLGTLWGYPVAMICSIVGIVTFLMILIVPKFEAIFEDFDVVMPGPTVALINAAKWMGGRLTEDQMVPGLVWILLGLLAVMLFNIIATAVGFGSLWSVLAWRLPVVGRLLRARAWSDACFVIHEAIEAGRPMDEAIGEAAKLRGNPVAAAKLHRWAQLVRAGELMPEAARRAGLPDMIVGTLVTAQGTDNMPAALAFLSRHYELQESWAAAVLRGAVVPAMVFFFGAIVAWIVVGLLMPLTALIWSVMPYTESVKL